MNPQQKNNRMSMMMPADGQPMISKIPARKSNVPPSMQKAKLRNTDTGDNRPLSVLVQPGAQLQQKAQAAAAEAGSSSANANNAKAQMKRAHSSSNNDLTAPELAPAAPPKSMGEAMTSFEQSKKEAKQKKHFFRSANSRLVNALADVTVVLLTRAMKEGTLDKLEIRVYKKPVRTADGRYAVAEYRDASKDNNGNKKNGEEKPRTDPSKSTAAAEEEFTVICAEELLPGEAGKERDNLDNWKQFFPVVQTWSLWWRYAMALHKRIGWKAKIDRRFLNVIDSRVLGHVTIEISNFV